MVFFSRIFLHSVPEEGLYCKPKYRAILFNLIWAFIPFYSILVISAVWISVPSISCLINLSLTLVMFISVFYSNQLPFVPTNEQCNDVP